MRAFRSRKWKLATVLSFAATALVLAGCSEVPTATTITGGGTFSTNTQPGQISLSYQVTNPRTGGGTMSGSYADPTLFSVNGSEVPVRLSFVNASSDFCYQLEGISCTAEVQSICSSLSSSASAYANCVQQNSTSACASARFTYQADGSALPSTGLIGLLAPHTGDGYLLVCGDPQGSGGVFFMALDSGPYAGYLKDTELASGGFTSAGGVSTTPPPKAGTPGSLLNLLSP